MSIRSRRLAVKLSIQFTAWSLWAHWSTVGGWVLSQFTVIILWAINIITLIICNSFFPSPLVGVVPKISCCGSIELSKFKISRISLFTPSQNFCNLGQSQKMWEKSPFRPQPLQQRGEYFLSYLAITKGVLKYLILSFQLNSLQVGLLKHLCQDIQELSHSSSVIMVLASNFYLPFISSVSIDVFHMNSTI